MKVFKKKKRGGGGLGIKEKKEDPCLPSPFSQLVAAVLLLYSGFQLVSLGLPRPREQNLVLPLHCTPQVSQWEELCIPAPARGGHLLGLGAEGIVWLRFLFSA